jgi:hypothetical protein
MSAEEENMKPGTWIKSKLPKWLLLALVLTLAPAALASNKWYVDGVNGGDSNDCMSSQTACQTIGHAISLARWGDTIMVAPATYTENLTINRSLKIIGSDARTTIVDGNRAGTVFTISNAKAHVHLSNLTIRNGSAQDGGGVYNSGILTINRSTINGNSASCRQGCGAGVLNWDSGTLTLNNSTISGNVSAYYGGGITNFGTLAVNRSTLSGNSGFWGGGIYNGYGTLKVDHSTLSGNSAQGGSGIYNGATLTISNSTISRNVSDYSGGGVENWGSLTINSSTLSGNSANLVGGIYNRSATATLQNTIVANNASGGNCGGDTMTSSGYNLSSDATCNFTGPGDKNNTDPKLGNLQDNGGPTQTIRLLNSSPGIDAGNPSGCTDDGGNLLKTDQRGWLRTDKQSGRCDIGALEREKN